MFSSQRRAFYSLIFLFLIPILAYHSQVKADDTDHIQELSQAEIVYPQERGAIQVSLSPAYNKSEDLDIFILPLSIEYGLTDAWQLELAWQIFILNHSSNGENNYGIGDLSIGSKYSFLNIAQSNFHTAIGFEITFPLGSSNKNTSEGFVEFEPYFVLAKNIPQLNNLYLFTQVSFNFLKQVKYHSDPNQNKSPAHEINWISGFVVPFSAMFFTTEFSWLNNEWNHDGDESEMYISPGLTWKLPGAWEIGMAFPIGLTKDSDDYQILTKISFEFNTSKNLE